LSKKPRAFKVRGFFFDKHSHCLDYLRIPGEPVVAGVQTASQIRRQSHDGRPKITIDPYGYFEKSEISTIFKTRRGRNGIPT
jgi:hypothetical protein